MKIRRIKSITFGAMWEEKTKSICPPVLFRKEQEHTHTHTKLKRRPQTNTRLWNERLISFRISPLSQSIDSPLWLRPQCLDSQTFAARLHSAAVHTAEVREVKSSMSSNHTLVLLGFFIPSIPTLSKSADMFLKSSDVTKTRALHTYVLMPCICNMYCYVHLRQNKTMLDFRFIYLLNVRGCKGIVT